MNGGTLLATNAEAVVNRNNTSTTINDGSVTSNTAAALWQEGSCCSGYTTAVIEVNSGTISGYNRGIYSNYYTTVNINGGLIQNTIETNSSDNASIYLYGNVRLNITDGKIYSPNSYGISNVGGDSNIVISNAEIETAGDGITARYSTLNVSDTKITSTAEGYSGMYLLRENATLNNVTINSKKYGINNVQDRSGTYTLNIENSNVYGSTAGIYNNSSRDDGYLNVNIKSGTIEGGTYGVQSNRNTITINIGENDDEVSTIDPSITGGAYGLYINSGIANMYDGRVEGGINSIYGELNTITTEYERNDSNSTILNTDNKYNYVKNGYALITDKTTGKKYRFTYTGSEQSFIVPSEGDYVILLKGADGNDSNRYRSYGGKGAYTQGTIHLNKDDVLYIYVGEHRSDRNASFNAGSTGGSGYDSNNSGSNNGYGGGGATDIRLVNGEWNSQESLASRIMVAAGGGGATDYSYPANGGAAGGLVGYSGLNGKYPNSGVANVPPTGATQTSGGSIGSSTNSYYSGKVGTFGIGGNGQSSYGSGGGGGYYGGSGGGYSSYSVDSGSGGSSYISGHTGSIAIKSSTEIIPRNDSNNTQCQDGTSDNICSVHYSGYKFTDTKMVDGESYSWTTSKGNIDNSINENLDSIVTILTPQPKLIRNTNTGIEYINIQTAIDEATNDDILEFINDINITYDLTINVSQILTFNMNGYNFQTTRSIKNYGNLTVLNDSDKKLNFSSIKDVTFIDSRKKFKINNVNINSYNAINNTGVMELDNVTISARNKGIVTSNELIINDIILSSNIDAINNSGKLTITNGDISNKSGTVLYNSYTGVIDVTNVDFNSSGNSVYNYTTGIVNLTDVNIKGTGQFVNNSTGTIRYTNGSSDCLYINRGSLEINNVDMTYNTTNYYGASVITNTNKLTLKDSSIVFNKNTSSNYSYYAVNSSGQLISENNEINVINNNNNSYMYGIYTNGSSDFSSKNDKIEITNNVGGANGNYEYAISHRSTGTATIDGSTLISRGAYEGKGYHNDSNSGEALIRNVDINVFSKNMAFGVYSYADVIIESGIVKALNSPTSYAVYGTSTSTVTLGIEDGSGTDSSDVSIVDPYLLGKGTVVGTGIKVDNGTFNYYDGKIAGNINPKPDIPTNIEFNYIPVLHYDLDEKVDYYVLEYMKDFKGYIAEVDGNEYGDLQSAISAAKDGSTVTLLKDTNEYVTNSNNIVLNLNDNTLTGSIINNKNIRIINGTIDNPIGEAIHNSLSSKLYIGDHNNDDVLSSPIIKGKGTGIVNDGSLYFYSGQVISDIPIEGNDIITRLGYTQIVEEYEDTKRSILSIEDLDYEDYSFTKNYSYTGNVQVFTAPYTGYYKLEAWGASGGKDGGSSGGLGSYSTGVTYLKKGETIYVTVGGKGVNNVNNSGGGYNGGGNAGNSGTSGGGGGATHISKVAGILSSLEEYKGSLIGDDETYDSDYILIVAGGGAGQGGSNNYLGSGGGYIGVSSSGKGGTQVSAGNGSNAGSFGQGGNRAGDGGGGGGGFYGGGAATSDSNGGGGSGYIGSHNLIDYDSIEKSMYCYDCLDSSNINSRTVSVTDYSTTPISKTALLGDGYARISALKVNIDDKENVNVDVTFDYSGSEEVFTAPISGYYKLETWGAQGGSYNDTYHGGYGGYSEGLVKLNKGDKLYINVGGSGKYIGPNGTIEGGYNGGGGVDFYWSDSNEKRSSGGGATHIATKSGLLYQLEDNKDSILIVAGGGGAAQVNSAIENIAWARGGSGGGFKGGNGSGVNYSTTCNSVGATQEAGGTADCHGVTGVFGKAPLATTGNSSGGGGGWYGGSPSLRGASGGSGYIGNILLTNKSMYCYDCETSDDESTKTYSTENVSNEAISEYAKKGNGYARVKLIESDISEYEYDYSGREETFVAPVAGYYKLEIWGAQGGSRENSSDINVEGGYGSYSSGTIFLEKYEKVYINVGGQGNSIEGGYNGGGSRESDDTSDLASAGGGATDISLESGLLSSFEENRDALIIAAGGGGGSGGSTTLNRYYNGGSGGGYKGSQDQEKKSTGGTQSEPGINADQTTTASFGIGASSVSEGAGGGGFYGGGSGISSDNVYAGSGGSGYIGNSRLIDKAMYCYNCENSNDENTKTFTIENSSDEAKSYYAKKGNGYAKITYLYDEKTYDEMMSESYVARIGKKYYSSLQEALSNSVDNSTIYLIKDVSEYVTSSGYVTLNLNGYTLYGEIINGGRLQILNGTIKNVTGTAIDNGGSDAILTIGSLNEGVTNVPKISGLTTGLINESNSKVYYLSGVISGSIPIKGNVITPNGYKVDITEVDNVKEASLVESDDPLVSELSYNFSYTGDYQTFVVPADGYYQIEAWGAASYPVSGKGAYTKGDIYLKKDTILYVYVGGTKGYNGGGSARNETVFGGGATDIRLNNDGNLSSKSLASRIMVAAGGGTYGALSYSGTSGGALSSNAASSGCGSKASSATQIGAGSRGSFGIGANGVSQSGGHGGAGGGGYWGGGSTIPDGSGDDDGGGSGGSSYISGHFGSIAIYDSTLLVPKVYEANIVDDSYHYSGFIFNNTKMIDGDSVMPDYNSSSTIVGNSADGYVKIKGIANSVNYESDELSVGSYKKYMYDKNVSYETFEAPENGIYTFELWGASSYPISGKGAYTKGDLYLNKGEKVYIYLGSTMGANGGGSARNETIFGGGATDIRLVNGEWNSQESLASRIMVAAGGGTYGALKYSGTSGGSFSSIAITSGCGDKATSATQIGAGSRGSFGIGANGVSQSGGHGGAGGGGYWGGGSTIPDGSLDDDGGGSGGSSYISGGYGFIAINGPDNITAKNVVAVNIEESYHYSGYKFENVVAISGDNTMLDINRNIVVGNSGNGAARITFKESKTVMLPSELEEGTVKTYSYSGSSQEFIAEKNGTYKIELYGASSYPVSGKGAYTSGLIDLNANDKLYVYVGSNKGYNGGGSSRNGTVFGGGATDIRLIDGEWNSQEGLASRIMVAAGGGTYGSSGNSGSSGGALSSNAITSGCGDKATSATQIGAGSRGSFGIGANGISQSGGHGGAGGGGYWGGGSTIPDGSLDDDGGGSGGSSYISGYTGSIAIKSDTDLSPRLDSNGNTCTSNTDDNQCSIHYSGLKFYDTVMISGNSLMPTYDGQKSGNIGYGFARITFVKEK